MTRVYLEALKANKEAYRFPTPEEIDDFRGHHMRAYGFDESDLDDLVRSCFFLVVPNYMTGGPNFSGKVMIVLYDGGPEYVESFIWRGGKIICQQRLEEGLE